MSRVVKLGQVATPSPSTGIIGYWPCFQSSSDTLVYDQSGKQQNMAFGAGLTTAEAWANSNVFSTVETTADDVAILSAADFDYSFNAGDTLLIAGMIYAAAPAATRTLIGNGYNSTSAQGFRFVVKTTGVCAPWLYQSGGDKFLSDTTSALADSSTKHFTFAWYNHNVSAGTASYMIWFNGVRQYASALSTSGLGTMTPVDDLRIGGNKTGASAYQSMAARFSALQMYRAGNSAGITLEQLDAIAIRLSRSPCVPLSASEWPVE